MKYTSPCAALAFTFMLAAGCSSSNDNNGDDAEQAVTGEFHEILPSDVDNYVAEFEADRSKLMFSFDGVQHPIEFEDLDQEDNKLIASYDNKILIIGFDVENDEPLPSIILLETDGDSVVNQYANENLMLTQSDSDDYLYSGTLKDAMSDEEFDVALVLNESLISGGNTTLAVSGSDAMLNGDLGTASYAQMRDMINNNPAVTRLIIQQSSGSVNDAINVHTARLVRAANLATHVPADGNINSGAVDLFAAGVRRSVETGGVLGVHSWCCKEGVTADQLDRSDEAHGTQLTYFREMLPSSGVDFYFFTLQAAPFDGIHAMTREEMERFDLVTE